MMMIIMNFVKIMIAGDLMLVSIDFFHIASDFCDIKMFPHFIFLHVRRRHPCAYFLKFMQTFINYVGPLK